MPKVKLQNKYIKTTSHVRQVLAESINFLRMADDKISRTTVEKHRVIGFLCNIALSSISQGEIEKRLEKLEQANE